MKEGLELDSIEYPSAQKIIPEMGLSYDDVLLIPQRSDIVSRKDVNISTLLTKKIRLNIPVLSANMDTVTESKMAVALAREGGMGIIHRFLTVEQQIDEVLKVKRSESVVIERPYTLTPYQTLREAKELMANKDISGLLIVDNDGKLIGILTNRDIKFQDDEHVRVSELMTKNPITAPLGTGTESAREILHQHRIEKLPLVDQEGYVYGLITAKDIDKRDQHPLAAKDKKGRLLVGAAIGVKGDYLERAARLIDSRVDLLVVDVAHGHHESVINTIKTLKKTFGDDIEVMAGNVATYEAGFDLVNAGADAIKIGVGGGSICVTRIVSGSGVPQLTAVMNASKIYEDYGIPVNADGGIKQAGDISKAIAAGANSVMLGNLLSGTEESPGKIVIKEGRRYKVYRGMAGFGATNARKQVETGKDADLSEVVPEGVEGTVPYRGYVSEVLFQLIGGLRSGMSYVGARTIDEMRRKGKFIRITGSGMKESKPHDVDLIK